MLERNFNSRPFHEDLNLFDSYSVPVWGKLVMAGRLIQHKQGDVQRKCSFSSPWKKWEAGSAVRLSHLTEMSRRPHSCCQSYKTNSPGAPVREKYGRFLQRVICLISQSRAGDHAVDQSSDATSGLATLTDCSNFLVFKKHQVNCENSKLKLCDMQSCGILSAAAITMQISLCQFTLTFLYVTDNHRPWVRLPRCRR